MGSGQWLERRRRRALSWWGARFGRIPRRGGAVLGLFCDCEGGHAGPVGERFAEKGLDRLLEMLAEHKLRITFNVVADLCRTQPRGLRSIVEAGHEIACHGWRHERPSDLAGAQIEEMLAKAADCFAELGVRPVGFRSPQSAWSVGLVRCLAARGYAWNAERDKAKEPYRIAGQLVRLPVATDDWDLADGTGTVHGLLAKWRHGVDGAMRGGQVICLGLHEWIVGRDDDYAVALGRFLGELCRGEAPAIRTLGEIAGR